MTSDGTKSRKRKLEVMRNIMNDCITLMTERALKDIDHYHMEHWIAAEKAVHALVTNTKPFEARGTRSDPPDEKNEG